MQRAFKRNTQLLNAFKKIFYEQYILALRERQERQLPAKGIEPELGDVVLIHDSEKHQLLWRLGVIEALKSKEALESKDGRHRSADIISVSSPSCPHNPPITHTLRRAIISLYPLEQPKKDRTTSSSSSVRGDSVCSSLSDNDNERFPNRTQGGLKSKDSPTTPTGKPSGDRVNAQKRPMSSKHLDSNFYYYSTITNLINCSTMVKEKRTEDEKNAWMAETYRKIFSRITESGGCTEISRMSLMTEASNVPLSTADYWSEIWANRRFLPPVMFGEVIHTPWQAPLLRKALWLLADNNLTEFDAAQAVELARAWDPTNENLSRLLKYELWATGHPPSQLSFLPTQPPNHSHPSPRYHFPLPT
jgi:hypothetical protein